MGLLDRVLGKAGEDEGITSPNDQSKGERDLCAFVRQKIDDVRISANRISSEAIWMTNTAYLCGYDSIYYDPRTRQFRNLQGANIPLRRTRVRVNKILPTVQNRLSMLCKNPPRYDVKPNSSDEEDKEAARLSLQVLQMMWDKQKLNAKRIPLYMWVQQCGHAFLKVSWDTELGEMVLNPETGSMEYEGDVRIDVVSPFEIFADPQAKSLDDATYIVQAKVRKVEYFRSHYPDKGQAVKPEDAWLMSTQYEQKIQSLNTQTAAANTQEMMKNSAIECVYYEKRTEKHPNGRMIVTANGVLLDDKDLPCGEFPFAKFDDIVVGGKFYPESLITHLRPIQDQYNRTISKRATWVNKLLAGKYIAAKGHGLMAEALNNESGEVVEFDPVPNAPPPQAMQVPNIPQYAYLEEEKLQEMIYDISGVNQVSRGILPSASIPALGMQVLQESDDSRLGIITEQHEYSFADIGRLILKLVGENYKTPRLLKVAGKNLQYTVRQLSGSDLRENYDVCVVRGSTQPGSKALKRQDIMNLYGQGLLGDPHDPKVREQVLAQMEFGDIGEAWQKQAIDEAQINYQIDQIKRGEIPEFNESDNHALHAQKKNELRITDSFSNILSPYSKQILAMDLERQINFLQRMASPGMNQEMDDIKSQMSDPAGAMVQEGIGDAGVQDLNATSQGPQGLNSPSPSPQAAPPMPQGPGAPPPL